MSKIDFSQYETKGFYDEMFDDDNKVRPSYELFRKRLEKIKQEQIGVFATCDR